MVSTSDDTVGLGRGRTWTYVPREADFTVSAEGGAVDVHVDGDTWWDVALRPTAPQTAVTVGRHEGVARAVVSGDGRGCGEEHARGWYEVDDVAYDGGELARLTVRFSQWCADKDSSRAMTGELRWDADAPVPPAPTPVNAPPASFWTPPDDLVPAGAERNHLVMAIDPGDFVGRGQTHASTGFNGQLFQDAFTLVHPELSWRVSLQPSNRASDGLEAGFYPQLLDHDGGNPVRGEFSVTGEARGCNVASSDVVVDRVDARRGVYRDIAFRFEQHCEFASRALRGQVVWQQPSPAGSPAAPTRAAVRETSGGLAAAWDPPANPGATPISGYEVVVYRNGTAIGETITAPADARGARLPGGSGGEVTVTVQAVNGSGAGPRTESAAVGRTGQDHGPLGSPEAVIAQQYRDFSGRPPSTGEVSAAMADLRSGTTLATWIAGMRNRPEWGGRRAPVIRLYTAAFLRPVDAGGLEYWSERRRTGTSLRHVAQAFALSQEFRNRYGQLTNGQFVDRVYRNVLGRAPDAGGSAYWTGRLDGGTSRGDVLLGFSESAEHRGRRGAAVDVTLLTTAMLRRAPAVHEVNVGGNVEGLALHHLTRAEYRRRFDPAA